MQEYYHFAADYVRYRLPSAGVAVWTDIGNDTKHLQKLCGQAADLVKNGEIREAANLLGQKAWEHAKGAIAKEATMMAQYAAKQVTSGGSGHEEKDPH